ncbi:F-BOX PROTEIN-LIKE [Salix purpurea]|uniref:F-BOX PROTEIN-LIKE n=1 Tax=Salix purpurea TaxID=77065 RepID=A0A9Q0VWF8_SALPP|nr:F-BOX PROTEIN-LIKE [Salix purpurea]
MQVEKIAFDFSCFPASRGRYNFPCHILPIGKGSHLKHLCLSACKLRLSTNLTSQFNPLRTLDLDDVHLDQSDLDDYLRLVVLKSINLEIFEFHGLPRKLTFSDVPQLKKAVVWSLIIYQGTSTVCNGLAKDLPQLQFLSLLVKDEVPPLPAATPKFNSLKQLDLLILPFIDSDLVTVSYLWVLDVKEEVAEKEESTRGIPIYICEKLEWRDFVTG